MLVFLPHRSDWFLLLLSKFTCVKREKEACAVHFFVFVKELEQPKCIKILGIVAVDLFTIIDRMGSNTSGQVVVVLICWEPSRP